MAGAHRKLCASWQAQILHQGGHRRCPLLQCHVKQVQDAPQQLPHKPLVLPHNLHVAISATPGDRVLHELPVAWTLRSLIYSSGAMLQASDSSPLRLVAALTLYAATNLYSANRYGTRVERRLLGHSACRPVCWESLGMLRSRRLLSDTRRKADGEGISLALS